MRKDVTFYNNNVQEGPPQELEVNIQIENTVVLIIEDKTLNDRPRLCTALQNVWNQKTAKVAFVILAFSGFAFSFIPRAIM